jgi:hypothetical protein
MFTFFPHTPPMAFHDHAILPRLFNMIILFMRGA